MEVARPVVAAAAREPKHKEVHVVEAARVAVDARAEDAIEEILWATRRL